MEKKFLAVFMCIIMILCMASPVFATSTQNYEKDTFTNIEGKQYAFDISDKLYCVDVIYEISDTPISRASISEDDIKISIDLRNSFLLYSFSDSPIAIFYKLLPTGYAIYDFSENTVLEYTKSGEHPFYTDANAKYYYNGVFNYYADAGNEFVNLATGQIISRDDAEVYEVESFYASSDSRNEYTENTRADNPVTLSNAARIYNCNVSSNYSYFFPNLTQAQINNCPGVCGSVACAVLIAYFDDYRSDLGDFATNWKKTYGPPSVGNNIYGKPLVKELVDYIEPNANGSVFLDSGVSSYLEDHGIVGGVSLGMITVYQQVKDSIGSTGQGHPIIVGTTNHYSAAVGYKNITEKQIQTVPSYSDNYVWISASTVISTWRIWIVP